MMLELTYMPICIITLAYIVLARGVAFCDLSVDSHAYHYSYGRRATEVAKVSGLLAALLSS
jgi:hypothetical protein